MARRRTLPAEVGHRLAALTDGEGCFSLSRQNTKKLTAGWHCAFVVKLRADDTPFLERMCRETGLGKVYAVPWTDARNPNPQTTWRVFRKDECLRLTYIFDEYPLWSKKARDYAIWREAVIFWATVGGGTTDWTPVAELYEQLRATRVYIPFETGEADAA